MGTPPRTTPPSGEICDRGKKERRIAGGGGGRASYGSVPARAVGHGWCVNIDGDSLTMKRARRNATAFL